MNKELEKIKSYTAAKRRIAICEWFAISAFFAGLWLTGGSAQLALLASYLTENNYVLIFIYIAIAGGVLYVITLPLDYASSFKLEHAFGISRQNIFSWLKDHLKRMLFSGMLNIVMILVLFLFLRISYRYWWLYAGITYFFASVILAKIFPQFIIPLFYKLTKINDPIHKERLKAIAERMGIKVIDVYIIGLGAKTSKANAAICGLGRNKRILLSDTLLEKYAPEEVEAALAHELSHYKRRHFWKLSAWALLSMLLCFLLIKFILDAAVSSHRLPHIYSVTAFPLIAFSFTAYGIISLPFMNFLSRRYEKEADSGALETTGDSRGFISLIEKLTRQNLSDPSPAFWAKLFFYDHPPASERIRYARIET